MSAPVDVDALAATITAAWMDVTESRPALVEIVIAGGADGWRATVFGGQPPYLAVREPSHTIARALTRLGWAVMDVAARKGRAQLQLALELGEREVSL